MLIEWPYPHQHTEEDRKQVNRRAAEIYSERSFNPKASLYSMSQMDPPQGDRSAQWIAIMTYIEKLERLAGVRSPHSRKLR